MTENNTQTGFVKKRKLRKRVYLILIVLLVLLIGATYATYLYFQAQTALTASYEDEGREKSDLRDQAVNPKLDNVSVLIMGVDSSDTRENEGPGRTDALIFATLNKKTKRSLSKNNY